LLSTAASRLRDVDRNCIGMLLVARTTGRFTPRDPI
jgi:hypothetical protein